MNEKNVESFAIGIIVVLLAFFLLDKKSGHSAAGNGSRANGGGGVGGGGGCGSCASDVGSSNKNLFGTDGTPQAPIAIGLNPLNPETAYGDYQKTGFQFS